ncbi:sigma-70 family RNA polymerase sigma factor [Streptomyces sp. ISL-100]|uniref:BACON domain-containing protein n=1 Tax=Streptomyces sp. ISL-100 TaxID=2819173 RepID=UPI001BED1994|nr:sigma-70 family RNA polymerase sigma factor [Streptomyces sp. ISL-100]MBT2401493.1 sigma-70 family RNA polymerase sigma factor [Streptomyces sp. ISL-100]
MTSSRLEPPTHTTGAHRAQSRAPRPTLAHAPQSPQAPPTRYEPYLDGLFTYCLSVLCDHDAATAVLGDVLAIAERQHGRCPSREPERKAWLYGLARWACLRRVAEQKRRRQGAHGGHRANAPDPVSAAAVPDETAVRRQRELALLAWPEAAGTTPEQREALELAVRHGLGPREVAAVLGMDYPAARELLAAAACEVERTGAALAVVESGSCPIVARLTGDNQVLLGAALRQELVRHVDDCPRCRRFAARTGVGGPWPGTVAARAALPVVEAPRAAAYAAMAGVPRARTGAPRFDRDGFPLDPKDHAARRDRLRTRAVTTTVVATVVVAPVFALWAAYRGAPLTGESHGGTSVTASEADDPEGLGDDPYNGPGGPGGPAYENTGNARTTPDPHFTAGGRSPDVSVEVVSSGTSMPGLPGEAGAGRLTVEARSAGSTTVLTLTAAGDSPVSWSAWTNASWLYLSQTSGTLHPGRSLTLYVSVDHEREPAGAWRARIGVDPTGAVIAVRGHGRTTPPPSNPDPRPSTPPPPTSPDPTPPPTSPDPTPTESTPPPSPDPTPTEPTTPPPSSDPTPTEATSPAP